MTERALCGAGNGAASYATKIGRRFHGTTTDSPIIGRRFEIRPETDPATPSVTSLEITIPRSYDPSWSRLGRYLRGRDDPRITVARYYFWAVVILVLMVLTGILAWAILHEDIVSDPQGPLAAGFWFAQLVGATAYAVVCGIGFRPAIHIDLKDGVLRIRHGDRQLTLGAEDVSRAEPVTAVDVHRHYARYRNAQIFIGPSLDDYLLLRTGDAVVVLGVDGRSRDELVERLSQREEYQQEPIISVAL